MNILGITSDGSGFHDSSVVLVQDGRIALALSEERYTREKHDASFPRCALQDLLSVSRLKPSDFAAVAVAWRPYNPFSGFFKRNLRDVPLTVARALTAAPLDTVRYALKNFIGKKMVGSRDHLTDFGFLPQQIHYVSHHLAHASSSFRTSTATAPLVRMLSARHRSRSTTRPFPSSSACPVYRWS